MKQKKKFWNPKTLDDFLLEFYIKKMSVNQRGKVLNFYDYFFFNSNLSLIQKKMENLLKKRKFKDGKIQLEFFDKLFLRSI